MTAAEGIVHTKFFKKIKRTTHQNHGLILSAVETVKYSLEKIRV